MGSWQVTTNQEPGQKNINTSKMKAVIQLLSLVGVSWAMAMPHLIEPKNAKMVNELMDVIESGLDTPKAEEGREQQDPRRSSWRSSMISLREPRLWLMVLRW